MGTSPRSGPGADTSRINDAEVGGIVGARLRHLRLAAGLTITDLANAAGMSKTHLSRIESGDRGLSLANLLTLASKLRVPVTSILPSDPTGSSEVVPAASPVVRASDLQVRILSNRQDPVIKPFHVIVPTERAWSPGATHPGEEWIYVLRGSIRVVHGGTTDTLHKGDSIHLDAREPHRLVASVEAELIVVVADMT